MDAIMVLVPCPTLRRNPAMATASREEALKYYQQSLHDEVVDAAREAALERLSVVVGNLRPHLVHEFVDTPATYARDYHVGAGTPFALSHGLGQLSLTRPGATIPAEPNILMVGASSRPGNGVPLVLMGAEQVAKQAAANLLERVTSH
jgi:phytoene dehydrogenase-like protein